MKFSPTLLVYIQRHYISRRNFSLLLRSFIIFVVLVLAYSVLFHVFMAQEGREFSVVGVWERGQFETAGPQTSISPHTVLVLAGSHDQLKAYDKLFYFYHTSVAPVVILGGGRVGRATGQALEERSVDYRIVEQLPQRWQDMEKYIVGNAADLQILYQAGSGQAPAVVITTHDDDTNIYLTLYCRHLRPDIQIISRATLERHIPTLHRAGADFVMSYASMGANAICDISPTLRRGLLGRQASRDPCPGLVPTKAHPQRRA